MTVLILRSAAAPGGGDRLVGDEWFATDLSTADNPDQLWGFDYHLFEGSASEDSWDLTWESNTGPAGRPCVQEVVYISSDGLSSSLVKQDVFTHAQCTWGDDFFIRFSIRFAASTGQEQKLIQLARGVPNNEGRCILTIEDWGDYAFRLQKDGGDDLIQYPDTGSSGLTHTNWINIQLHGRYSSAEDVADGYYAIYYNNDNFASPNAASGAIVLNTSNTSEPNDFGWSGLHQQMTGTKTYRWADVRIGPTFDSSWNSSGT